MNHLSWERSNVNDGLRQAGASSTNTDSIYNASRSFNQTRSSRFKKDRSKPSKSRPDLSLLAFGYSCKLFNDDEQARYLDQGKNLVEWSGDSNLLIDRFDVRSYLNQNELEKYEAKVGVDYKELLTEDEIELDKKLNKERFRDLYSTSDNETKNDKEIDQDDELKKWKESVEEKDDKVNQFQFNYDNLEQSYKNEDNNQPIVEKQRNINLDDKKFELPDGLNLPSNLLLPSTMREHNLIEKTAKFISKQGDQMEIILKMKQSNTQFDFLNYDSPLNPYYKCLVKLIRENKYKPNILNDKPEQNETEESDDDGTYLHPFLQGSNAANKQSSTYDLQSTNASRPTNSLYSKLAENLKDKIVVDKSYYEPKVIESKGVKYDLNKNDNDKNFNQSSKDKPNNQLSTSGMNQPAKVVQSVFDLMPEIPSDIKLIIEKLAQYVSKNGEEFEKTVKSRNEQRFDFLNSGHKFHWYYVKTKLKLQESKRKQTVNKDTNLSTENADSSSSNNLVASETNQTTKPPDKQMNEFDSSQKVVPFMISSKRQTFKDDLEAKLKEKQEERKRKAALFLNKLKQQKGKDEPNEDTPIGPQLPTPSSTRKETIRNTPSPLREFYDDLDVKEAECSKDNQLRKDSFDELKLRNDFNLNGSPEVEASFKKKSANREHYRRRESSSSSDSDSKSSLVDRSRERRSSSHRLRRSSSRESKHHHRSSKHRASRSRTRSKSPRHHHKRRSHHRSKSRDRHRRSRSPKRRH